jgi:hypothetical protein
VGYLDGTRRAVIETEGLDVDETIIYTSGLVIRLTAEGTIEARTLGGTAKRLAFHDDVQAIRDALHEHEHTYKLEGVDTFTTGGPSVPSSTGTSVLMGE